MRFLQWITATISLATEQSESPWEEDQVGRTERASSIVHRLNLLTERKPKSSCRHKEAERAPAARLH